MGEANVNYNSKSKRDREEEKDRAMVGYWKVSRELAQYDGMRPEGARGQAANEISLQLQFQLFFDSLFLD